MPGAVQNGVEPMNGVAHEAFLNGKVFGKVLDSAIKTGCHQLSELQRERLEYPMEVPSVLKVRHRLVDGDERTALDIQEMAKQFPNLVQGGPLYLRQLEPCGLTEAADPEGRRPLRVGVVLSGGQAAGGHNVIWGLFDYLRYRHPGSSLFGFLDGPRGVMQKRFKEVTAEELQQFKNQGGFHLLGSGRDKIEKEEHLAAAAQTCRDMALDGLVVVGGDDSNTNACCLAEYFLANNVATSVVGCPKTMDGDLKCRDVPCSFGFDTACKVYAEMIGNVEVDASSARKYWHFVRLMGRSSSHVTLEVALQVHPQWAFISEEVEHERIGPKDVAKKVADLVAARAAMGRNYGVILLPEGLIEVMEEFKTLFREINDILAADPDCNEPSVVAASLSPPSREVFSSLAPVFQRQFLEDRDPHGNVQVAHIETEKLLISLVKSELAQRKVAGTFNGKFSAVAHYFGYEGRCSLPSNFDATYTFSLGAAAASLVAFGNTGVMAMVNDLHLPAKHWRVGGVPLVTMMHMEHRAGKSKPVIAKALVDLHGAPMAAYRAVRDHWALHDCYRSPGPIQFRGHDGGADRGTITLALEINDGNPMELRTLV